MEENKRFSLSGLLIKIIIVIIFVLFTIWLLSLGNKEMTNSLGVLTDNIFSQNIEKMKQVGKEYFTTERLPKKVGEVETLTLEKMYEKKLILKLTDKYGKACSMKDSYVSVEKYDDEYQMKVYLECGDESDYIIIIMGCYDYCDTDICEKVEVENKKIEYQYVKTTGGSWTNYGTWSEWSKVIVTNTDYRQVETKVEKEKYSFEKEVTSKVYEKMNATCPVGYTQNGNTCVKEVSTTERENPICPKVDGYTYVGRDGFTCKYSKTTTETTVETTSKTATCPTGYEKSGSTCIKKTSVSADPVCIAKDGYEVTRDGFTCNYVKNTNSKVNPTCPTIDGYEVTREGFTCNYVKTTSATVKPTCPKVDGYTMYQRDGFTCNYRRNVKGDYVDTVRGELNEEVPKNNDKYMYVEVGAAQYVYDCKNECQFGWIHTWEIYKNKVEKTTKTATCPTGYDKLNGTCVKNVVDTKVGEATCPAGYNKSGTICVKNVTDAKTENAVCPTGYNKSGNTCIKVTTSSKNPSCATVSGYEYVGREGFTCKYSKTIASDKLETITKTATCPIGFDKSSTICYKTTVATLEEDLIKSCPTGYEKTSDDNGCYKDVISKETVEEVRDVTYYRYRIREYKGGTTDYKWSFSNNDKTLINAGYKLTGRTR